MKNYITKLLLIGFLALPQVASAFPALNKPSEVAPLVHALYHDKDSVTISGTKYKIKFESALSRAQIRLINVNIVRLLTNIGLSVDKMGVNDLKKNMLIMSRLLKDDPSDDDVFKVLKLQNPTLTKAKFKSNPVMKDFAIQSFSLIAKLIGGDKRFINVLSLKNFLGYKKVGNGKEKQRYCIAGKSGSSKDFFLVAPKAKDVVTKAGSSKKKDDKKAKKAKKKVKKTKK